RRQEAARHPGGSHPGGTAMVRRTPNVHPAGGDAMTPDPGEAATGPVDDEVSLLSWLRTMADRNVPEAFGPVTIPVAWLGRTSTDDNQDPTLSLPRQLGTCRSRLPDDFVIVAHFYDVESGRTA